MRDQLQREIVDARVASRRSIQQTRESSAVTFRQVPARGANLLFDQIKIVEQPFTGRRNVAIVADRFGHQFVRLQQNLFVGRQPSQQPIGAMPRIDHMPFRECFGMLL